MWESAEGQAPDAYGTGAHAGANATFFFEAGVAAPALPCMDAEFGDADLGSLVKGGLDVSDIDIQR